MMRWYLFIFLVLVGAVSVSAASIDDTLINITGLNTTINITEPWTFTNLTVYNHSLVVQQLQHVNEKGFFTFNFSDSDKRYFGSDFPYFSTVETTRATITSNLSANMTTEIYLAVSNCDQIYNFTYNDIETSYLCYENTLYFTGIIENGDNSLLFAQSPQKAVCLDGMAFYQNLFTVLGILGSILGVLAIIAVIYLQFNGTIQLSLEQILVLCGGIALTTVIMGACVVILGAFMSGVGC